MKKKPAAVKEAKYKNEKHVVYYHYNSEGTLLYIGACLNIFHRMANHMAGAKWFDDVSRIEIKHFSNKADAYKAEKEAILSLNPLHNKQRIPFKKITYREIEFLNTGVMPEKTHNPQDRY